MTDRTRNLGASLLMLVLAAAFLFFSYQLTGKGETVPVLIGWIAVFLCVLDVIAHTDNSVGRAVAMLLSGSTHLDAESGTEATLSETVSMAWMVIATAAIVLFGFLIATPVYVFAYMILHGKKPIIQSGMTALVTTLFVWVVFELLMEYQVYRGLLFEDL